MGKCVICGKEGVKSVGYYSADLVDESKSHYYHHKTSEYSTPQDFTISTTTYRNIEKQYGYYCFRHNIPFFAFIIGVVNLLLTIAAIQSIIEANKDPEWYATYFPRAAVFLAILLVVWIIVIYFVQAMITGKYYIKFIESLYWKRDSEYEVTITKHLNRQAKKYNTGKRYLTSSEFKQLKSVNK